MATFPAPLGTNFSASRFTDSVVMLNYTLSAAATLAVHAPVAVGTGATGPDVNVRALGGVMELGSGDAAYLSFAKSGTVTTPTFLVTYWRPIRDKGGNIVGYAEYPLNDVGSALTYGTFALGTAFATVCMADGTDPVTAAVPAGTEVYAKAITCNVGGVAVSTSLVLNNMDLIKTTDDVACILRVTPFDGASHIRVQQQDTGAGGGKMFCFAFRGRGLALNR